MEAQYLYRKNSLGIGTWRIWHQPVSASHAIILIAHCTVEGGSEIVHRDDVKTNLSGRSIMDQVTLEMKSRISRQLDKGYKYSLEEALKGSTNQLGLINPMLAQKLQDVTLTGSDFNDAYVQYKLDGHRCLITKQAGAMLAYSRKGKPIDTIPHILEDAYNWMQDGDTLDGELYIHGRPLQSISSLIKRNQPDSKLLQYHWYDIADKSAKYGSRYSLMKDLFASSKCPQLKLVETTKVEKMSEVYAHFREARSLGYEGSMLRLSKAGYQDAHRANQLIKIKERHDCEVTVISGRPSARGWAILRVMTDDGVEFDVSAPGSVQEKLLVMLHIDKYISKRLTIEYAMLTDDKVPFHAVATAWREDI